MFLIFQNLANDPAVAWSYHRRPFPFVIFLVIRPYHWFMREWILGSLAQYGSSHHRIEALLTLLLDLELWQQARTSSAGYMKT